MAARKKSNVTPLPQTSDIPPGMKQLGGGFAPAWSPEKIGDSIQAVVSDMPKPVVFNKGTKKEHTSRVIECITSEGERQAVWESAVLSPLFDAIQEYGETGQEIYIRFDGLGKAKGRNNPPKLFTIAMSE